MTDRNERETLLAAAESEEWQFWIEGKMLFGLWFFPGHELDFFELYIEHIKFITRSEMLFFGYDRLKRAGVI